ncbi:MAG: hypothetical protein K2W82_01655 [Candidatus Obscuribacterales bacterium]|nr:hypothetical protein [Candidatus Obscuribacterales bacterium]
MPGAKARNKGQSIIETVVGIIVLVPIVLFLFDVAVLVLANTANDNLAKSCARAAAGATNAATGTGDGQAALIAAQNIANNFQQSLIIRPSGGNFVAGFGWVPDNGPPPATQLAPVFSGNLQGAAPAPGQVAVLTRMRVTVPVPMPGLNNSWDFNARAIEPIVSLPPQ